MAKDYGDWGPQPAALSEYMLAELRAGRTSFRHDKEPLNWRDLAAVLVMMGIVFAMTLGVLHFWPKEKAEMPRPPANAWMGAAKRGSVHHGGHRSARQHSEERAPGAVADDTANQAPAPEGGATAPASADNPAPGEIIVQ